MAFLGIRIAPETARLLKQIDVPGDKVAGNEYHITIACFEDNYPITEIAKAMEASYDVISKFEPFLVSTEEVASFPKREDKPCAIIAKIKSKELHRLNDDIKKHFDKQNIEYSKLFRTFKPHITLAYNDEEIKEIKIDPVKFVVQDIVLWAGDHGDDRMFITFPLKGPECKKHSYLLDKAKVFYKLATAEPGDVFKQSTERRKLAR